MDLTSGLTGSVEMVVSDDDTALALGSGEVPVLATPRVVRLVEQATVRAIDGRLEAGSTTVGHRVQLDHLAPSAVGASVRAEAVLETVEGRRLTFRVTAADAQGLVAAGRITRVVVDKERFVEKAAGP